MDNPLRVPIRNVLLHTGERVPLAGFYQERPLVLLFLRHLGCIFCKEQVAMVRDANDLNLAFVCLAQPGEASAFRESMNSPQPYFCEPEGDLYRDFGLGRGSFTQLVGPRMVMRGVQATLRGFSNIRPLIRECWVVLLWSIPKASWFGAIPPRMRRIRFRPNRLEMPCRAPEHCSAF